MTTLTLFHASQNAFLPGQVVKATAATTFYPTAVVALEKARPAGLPSRSTCVFATDSAEYACDFMRGQGVSNFHLYEVEVVVKDFHRAPVILVHQIACRIKNNKPYASLVREYWGPSQPWKYYEYFGATFKVISEAAKPDTVALYSFYISYKGSELDRAKSL